MLWLKTSSHNFTGGALKGRQDTATSKDSTQACQQHCKTKASELCTDLSQKCVKLFCRHARQEETELASLVGEQAYFLGRGRPTGGQISKSTQSAHVIFHTSFCFGTDIWTCICPSALALLRLPATFSSWLSSAVLSSKSSREDRRNLLTWQPARRGS